jgi:hypothetical protein
MLSINLAPFVTEMGSGAGTCLTAFDKSQGLNIKKRLVNLTVQLEMYVSNVSAHVFNVADVRVIMSLQDMCIGNAVNVYKACGQTAIIRL